MWMNDLNARRHEHSGVDRGISDGASKVRYLRSVVLVAAIVTLSSILSGAAFGAPCDVQDNGTGTASLPPAGCEYIMPNNVFVIDNDLPPGTTIELDAIHKNFLCNSPSGLCTIALPSGVCEGPGGSLGGTAECYQSALQLSISGTGGLSTFSRNITMQMDAEVHAGPRTPGDPLQSFPSELFRLQGEIFGDPDFCTFRIRAGAQNGLPSPGSKTLSDDGGGIFAVSSFFDVEYEIDFIGCPGSQLEGFGGTSSGNALLQTGDPIIQTVPGLRGGWLGLVAGVIVLSSASLLMRRHAA